MKNIVTEVITSTRIHIEVGLKSAANSNNRAGQCSGNVDAVSSNGGIEKDMLVKFVNKLMLVVPMEITCMDTEDI